MSHAVIAWGRFNPPTEEGHGKLVKAAQDKAKEVGGTLYVFPTHTQDKKKNPMTHDEKVGAMKKLFPKTNIVSHSGVRTIIDAMKYLESKGYKEVTVVAGSDRVGEYQNILTKYRSKEYPGIKKVHVVSAGHRDPDAEGAEGMSASKLRGLVASGKKSEFVSHYSDKKLGAHIHDRVKAGMQMESFSPKCIFLLGGPGCGKDYVINNIFSRFDLSEVQYEQIFSGKASSIIERSENMFVHGINDLSQINEVKSLLEGYEFDHIFVSVTNKVSRLRNSERDQPISEQKRIDKFLKAEKLAESIDGIFRFNNSINLNESSEFERIFFTDQIQKLLERLVSLDLKIKEEEKPKPFSMLREKKFAAVPKDKKSGLPKKYVSGLSSSTAKARAAHWKEKSKLSDRDPRAYEPAPGDATAKTKPSKHTLAVRKMMANEAAGPRPNPPIEAVAKKHGVSVADLEKQIAIGLKIETEHTKDEKEARRIAIDHLEEIPDYYTRLVNMEKSAKKMNEGAADSSIAAKAAKSGISVDTLRKVYKRGVAAWNSGHRPGTTPSQWGHARVNSYINKGKTYHTADKDLNEETELDESHKVGDLVSYFHQGLGDHLYGRVLTIGDDHITMKSKKQTWKVPLNMVHKADEKKVPKYRYEETELDDINTLFERQLVGTDEYRKHAIAMTPGQDQEIEDVTPCACGGNCKCNEVEEEVIGNVDTKPKMVKDIPKFRKFRKQVIPSPGGVSALAPPIFIGNAGAMGESTSVAEAVDYHLKNNLSLVENVFRPGSEKFFEVIKEAKKLFKEGSYSPKDEWEEDLLNSDVGQYAAYEGTMVPLDFPFEEETKEKPLSEDDPTGGKGIGKPWREGGGGAVYVRTGDGGVKKVSFSKSGMAKKYNDPAATRSFVARHRCLTNKDKTSASYWACRWPRFFSNSGKVWW